MTSSLEPAVQELLEAANKGDLTGFLATFTEDGIVDDWGREFHGAAAIQGWSDAEFIGKQVTLAVQQVERRGNESVVTAQVGGNGFNGPSHFGFQVSGDRIARMTIRK